MSIPVEIAPKRKIFYELLIKILKSQQKEEIEIEFEDLKTLELKLKEFKNEFPRFNSDLITKIEEFIQNLNVLEKIDRHIFLEETIEQLNKIDFKTDNEQNAILKLKELIEARVRKIKGIITQISIDKEAISQVLKDIIIITDSLISKIKPIYNDFIKKQHKIEDELHKILENYAQIKKITSFKEFQDKFKVISRIIRDKGLIYSVSQINNSLNNNKIDNKRANSLLFSNIFPKLDQAIILFIINTLGPQTIENLHQKTAIPEDKVFQGILSILDRKEIEIVEEKEGTPIYSKIKIKSNIVESVNKNLKLLINFRDKIDENSKSFNKIIENLNEFKNYLELIDEFDEKTFQESIVKLNSKIQKLAMLIPLSALDKTEEKTLDRIDAMIEALNLYRLKLTFEKKDDLQKTSSELEDKVSKLILDSIDQDFERGHIISAIKKKGPLNIIAISKYTGLSKDKTYSHMIQLKNDNRIKIIGSKDGYDLYDVPRVKTEEEALIDNFLNTLVSFQVIQTNYENAIVAITFNLDKINKYLDEFLNNLNKLRQITYLNQEFGETIHKEYLDLVKGVQDTLKNIKGKVKLKKAEINFDKLVPILVPATEDQYADLIEPKQLIGFGTIKSLEKRCLSCRS
ncbi:MAG: hypothetical protein ACFFCM_14680, partial [Promethearchaeota archaeon]